MFTRLLTYFLLINFLNTVCFPDVRMAEGPDPFVEVLCDQETDNIDSLLELVTELCQESPDFLPDEEGGSNPELLKNNNLVKDFLLPCKVAFPRHAAALSTFSKNQPEDLTGRTFDTVSPPPEYSI